MLLSFKALKVLNSPLSLISIRNESETGNRRAEQITARYTDFRVSVQEISFLSLAVIAERGITRRKPSSGNVTSIPSTKSWLIASFSNP